MGKEKIRNVKLCSLKEKERVGLNTSFPTLIIAGDKLK